ncbi:MAG: Flp pilus assembly protein CpaB [Hyphomonadaceae bacterium]
MSARRLIVLAIAFIAAIGALLVIRGMGDRAEPASVAAADIPGERVLVASRDIPQGAALSGSDMEWRAFPVESVNDRFIQEARQPNAATEMAGWVTRRSFVAGEPILTGYAINRNERGFMAAQLAPGYRAVSVPVNDDSAAGSFIQPNDRVDVLLTVETQGQNREKGARTTVVLEDVRVLAIGQHVNTQAAGEAPERMQGDVAVLELSQTDSRLLAQAQARGDVSLALRGVEIEPPGLRVESSAPRGRAQDQGGGVRVHAYGSLSTGGGS